MLQVRGVAEEELRAEEEGGAGAEEVPSQGQGVGSSQLEFKVSSPSKLIAQVLAVDEARAGIIRVTTLLTQQQACQPLQDFRQGMRAQMTAFLAARHTPVTDIQITSVHVQVSPELLLHPAESHASPAACRHRRASAQPKTSSSDRSGCGG
eukprot:2518243-Rhodomonas_salina.1